MMDDSREGLAYSLALSIAVCTVICSIGPLLTNYYFVFTILILVSIVAAMEMTTRYQSYRNKVLALQNANDMIHNWDASKTRSPKRQLFKDIYTQERLRHTSCP